MRVLAAVALSFVTAFTGIAPASAMPVPVRVETGQQQATVPVETVQYRRHHRRYAHRHYRPHRSYYRHNRYRHHYRHDRRYRAGIPLGALAAGAIIGGALAAPRAPRAYGGNSHVSWCYNRYRSYRAYDNTFQPYNGPRQLCYSPYR